MKIIIDNRIADKYRLKLSDVRALYKVCKTIFATEETKRFSALIPKDIEISLSFVDDEEIAKINEEYRGIARATDVLSFPMFDAEESLVWGSSLGDLVISVDTMKRQAAEYGHSEKRELCFLFVHGLLHLLGYDHEISEAEEKLQFARQDQVLEMLGITR